MKFAIDSTYIVQKDRLVDGTTEPPRIPWTWYTMGVFVYEDGHIVVRDWIDLLYDEQGGGMSTHMFGYRDAGADALVVHNG